MTRDIFRAALDASALATALIERAVPGDRIVYANAALEEMTGRSALQLTAGAAVAGLLGPGRGRDQARLIERSIREGAVLCTTAAGRRADGGAFLAVVNVQPLRGPGAAANLCRVDMRDITSEAERSRRLQYAAWHDALTGLPNRRVLRRCLGEAIFDARSREDTFAVAFVDLDGFKRINDEFGHALGDDLLRLVGARLSCAIRESDTVLRYGGDEFVVVLRDLGRRADCAEIAQRLYRAVQRPILIRGTALPVACSVGVSLFPLHGRDPQTLLERADAAMYSSKTARRQLGLDLRGPASEAAPPAVCLTDPVASRGGAAQRASNLH
jgi:diguanylate cyclase (GGDEF)-like protein/PAS domain S-box-containing protein